jgi:hypothetical protein
MLADGLSLSNTRSLLNLNIELGPTFPTTPNQGRVFYLNAASGSLAIGLYVFDGTAWQSGDITSVIAGNGLLGGGTIGDITLSLDPSVVSTVSSLNAEITRAEAAETTLTTNLAAEVTNRIAADALKVNIAGDTMTGLLVLSGDPTLALGAATKQYVDSTEATIVTSISNEATARTAADALKVNKAGDSMTGNLVMGGSQIQSVGSPVNATDVATKNYVDSLVSGLSWLSPVDAVLANHTTFASPVSGTRVLDTTDTKIYTYSGTAYDSGYTPVDGNAVFNKADETGYVFSGLTWVQFTGTGQITAGIGLSKTGNQIDVNLGAGIAQLPTDEVGVDVYVTGGLMNTVDGVNSSTITNAQLSLTNLGTAGTYKSVTTDIYGRITAGTNPTTLAGYGITDAQSVLGYTPVNKAGDTMTGNLTGTAFRAAQGIPNNADSSTVGYAFGADGDTGLFSPIVTAGSTNGVASIFTNNVERLHIDVNGIDVKNNKILNVATPVSSTDGVNKSYVDTATAAITLGYTPVNKAGDTMTGALTNNVGFYSPLIELGITTATSTPFVDFHSSGNNIDYDSRIIANGGNTSIGQGSLTYNAAGGHTFSGSMTVNGTTSSTADITLYNSGTNGTNLKLTGDGATTPSKTIRVHSGTLEVINSAYTTSLLTLTDAGNLSIAGTYSGNGSSLTSLTAANLTGTISSTVLGNSTLYIGTTAIALNRASATQTLTGVNLDTTTLSGTLETTGAVIIDSNDFRFKPGTAGTTGISVIARNDGTNFYFMTTANNDALGTWNTLRPFTINITTGLVTLGSASGVTTASTDVSTSLATTAFVATATSANATKWAGANKTVSTAAPSGGVDGDIWIVRVP